MSKQKMRKQMLELRSKLTKTEIERRSYNVIEQIKQLEAFKHAKCIASFKAFQQEIDLSKLTHEKACFAYPKVEKDGIHFYKDDGRVVYSKSKFGIEEIDTGEIVDEQIDFIIVPALAIDKDLYRIGYGKGYYDKFLQKYRPKTVIGVIYDFQQVEKIDCAPHDQRLDDFLSG